MTHPTLLLALTILLLAACAAPSAHTGGPGAAGYSIQNVGSDTMVNLALGAGRTIASDVAG